MNLRRRRILHLISLLGVGFALVAPAPAAAVTTTAMGQIWDATHNTPCAGAWVWVHTSSNSVYANSQGFYLLKDFDVPSNWTWTYQGVTRTGFADLSSYPPIQPGSVNTINASVYAGSLLSGVVRSHETGSPVLAGATVTAQSSSTQTVLTQADGSYQVRVPPGSCNLDAFQSGYARSLRTFLTCVDGVDRSGVDFQLYLGGILKGTVYYGDTTLTAADLWVNYHLSGGYSPSGSTKTASDGTYTLDHVYPAPVDISALPPDHWAGSDRTYVPVLDQVTTTGIDIRFIAAGDLCGTITAYTGAPVANVHVTLSRTHNPGNQAGYGNTDAQGFYTVSNLPVGHYDIAAQPPQGTNLQTVQVGNETIQQFTPTFRNFTLQPGGRIAGTARNQDGSVVPHAQMDIYLDPQYPFNNLFGMYTDAGGNYSFDGLTPYLNYAVSLNASESNTFTAGAAKHGLSVSEQETRVLDFSLPVGGGVRGTLLDFSGAPISGTSIALFLSEAQTFGRAITGSTYQLSGLPAGDYYQVFLPFLVTNNVQPRSFVTHITAGQISDLNISLAQGGSCSGNVYTAGSVPAVGVQVLMKSTASDLAGFVGPIARGAAMTDGGGHFSITGLAALPYDLEALPQVTDTNGLASAHVRLDLASGVATIPALSLSTGGQKVYGSVRDEAGNRLSNSLVYFWNGTGFRAFAETDDFGNYAIMLAPGGYTVQGFYNSMLGPNFAMEPMGGVQVMPGQNLQKDIVLGTGGSVTGKLTDQLGRPIRQARVWAFTTEDVLPYRYSFTDSTGAYTIRGLHSSSYLLGASVAGYADGSGGFSATLGQKVENLNLVMVEQTSIAGTVRDADRPLAGATVQALPANGGAPVLQTSTNGQGEYILAPLSGGPFRIKAFATGLQSQVQAGHYPGDRADFLLAPLIGHDEAISYPNPCRGPSLTFLYWLDNDATVRVRVYNQNAELVWDWEGRGTGQMFNKQSWEVSGVAPGVYLFKVTARDDGGSTRTFPTGKLTVIK